MEIAKRRSELIDLCMTALCATQQSTCAGSRDTELKAFAVMPCGCSPPTVSTMTPVANIDMTSRMVAGTGGS